MRRKRRVELLPVDSTDLSLMYEGRFDFPLIAVAGMESGKHMIGFGGLAWVDGKCWLWVDYVDMKRTHPMVMVRAAQRMLRKAWQLGETEVRARRDVGLEPLSEKLLMLLGFTKLSGDEKTEDWVTWPHSPQLPLG